MGYEFAAVTDIEVGCKMLLQYPDLMMFFSLIGTV